MLKKRERADENADIQHHKLGRDAEEIEMSLISPNCQRKSRKMDQKSCRVEGRTHRLDKGSQESRKTGQMMEDDLNEYL